MNLTWNGCRFNLICSIAEKELAKQAGFHFDYQSKVWWTGRIEVAQKFELFADFHARQRFSQEHEQIQFSKAVDSDINPPVPPGLSYLGFQKAGIAFALSRKNTLIADEMGLGKTIQAIGVINAEPGIKKILIVPPASLLLNWRKELIKWLVNDKSGGYAYEKYWPTDTNIVILNYEQVKKFRKQIDSTKWDLAIFDEAHYLKNPESQRCRACLGYDSHGKAVQMPIDAGMRIFLTGTPVLNRPIELWPILRVADPEGLGSSHWNFANKYCNAWEAPWGWDFSGANKKHLEELQNRLRSSIMIRRLKKDVLKDLPPKRRQIITIDSPKAKKVVQEELGFYEKNEKDLKDALEIASVAQAAGDEETYKRAVKAMRTVKQAMFEMMSKLRHDTAVAKVPFVIEYLENMLEQEEKIVLFAYHHDVIDSIYSKFKDIAVKMYDSTPITERQNAVDRFQEDDKTRLIIGSIGTMGVGWTLTRASYCLFCELDWVPANLSQAEDRLHRIGQLESVLIHHFCFDNSLDANMAQKLIAKQEIIDATIG